MSFEEWFKQVNKHVNLLCGLDAHDLADWPYMDAYEDEEHPGDVAKMVLEEEGFPL